MPLGTLPEKGKKLWESVYNASKKDGDKTEVAARKAWAAVKGVYKKVNGKWVKKSDFISEFSMYITKSSLSNGTMTWSAVNSDTDPDSYNERMSLELYKSFIENMQKGEIPEEFRSMVCSDFWCGGLPYLSISHYPDLNGDAVPGETLEVYVDGNKLKAKGILYDNALGRAVWRSLKEDKNKNNEDKIRISIGFLDMSHKHGENGNVWVRQSALDLCPECLSGIGGKIYLNGYLIHDALTRSPVNKRTEMVLEEKSEMAKRKTRKDDAASIVGEDLANEIDTKSKTSTMKSDVLIEMSEAETEEETQELIAEAEAQEEVAEVAPEEVAPVEEAVQDPDPESVAEPVEEKAEVEKMEDETMNHVANEPLKYDESYPLNGAVTMQDAEAYLTAQSEMEFVVKSWEVFSTVIWNIIQRDDIMDKKEMTMKAVDEFRNLLTAKSMVLFSQAKAVQTEPVQTELVQTELVQHELQPVLDSLLQTIDNSVNKSIEVRAEQLNPALQNLGTAITDYIESKSVVEQPVPENKDKDNLEETLQNLLKPIGDSVALLSQEVKTLKSQVTAQEAPKSRIPQPRTAVVPPQLQQKAEVVNKSTTPKLRDIIEKSVLR